MDFDELKSFQKRIEVLNASENLRELKEELSQNPRKGNVIPGMDGLRKVRMGLPNRGKSDGARVLYLFFPIVEKILFLLVYSKGDTEDLSPDERKIILRLVKQLKQEYEST